tara:strand:+ start:473 stop:781 length:309 start_codon:yes stop_codon:yes gene_type:complete
MSIDFEKPIDIFQSVSVIITPHEKGFTCGIIDPKNPNDRDVCSYIAKGLVKYATENPDQIYADGVQAYYDDDRSNKDRLNTSDDNVIDILDFINKPDDKDLH